MTSNLRTKSILITTAIIAAILLPISAASAETAVEAAVKQYSEATERAKAEYEAKVKAARDACIIKLKAEMTALTKAGDLDAALKVREKIAALV